MLKNTPAADRLDLYGIEYIAAQIEQGRTFGAIAAEVGVSRASLHHWLSESHSDRSAHARLQSAEAWLDRGLEAVESSLQKSSGIDPTAAKALAQECARRAAIRNPQYRDRPDTTVKLEVSPLAAFIAEIQRRGSTIPIATAAALDGESVRLNE